jgi:hypothetical protein
MFALRASLTRRPFNPNGKATAASCASWSSGQPARTTTGVVGTESNTDIRYLPELVGGPADTASSSRRFGMFGAGIFGL